MLVNINVGRGDPILDMIAQVNGNSTDIINVDVGIYQIGDFSFDMRLKQYNVNEYAEVNNGDEYFGSYGVCDDVENFKDKLKHIIDDKVRKFVVSFTPIEKSTESPRGGWRWHKWGDYIGNKNPQHEYIYDEDDSITKVYVYHIYQILD